MGNNPLSLYDLLLNSPSALVAANALGKIIHVTSAITDLLGWTPKELIGKPLVEIMPVRYRAAHAKGFKRWSETGELALAGKPLRLLALHKNGSEVPIEVILGVYQGVEGDQRVVGMLRDVRDYIELEEESERLQRELNFIRSITLNMAEAVIAQDISGSITLMNKSAETIVGWTEIELLGKNAHDTIHCKRPDGICLSFEECPITSVLKTEQFCHIPDDYFLRKDGTFANVSVNASPIIRDHKMIGMVVSFRDIFEEKRKREALEESEKRYRDLVELSPDAMAVHTDGIFVFANQALIDMVKARTESQIVGQPVLKFIDPAYHDKVLERLARVEIGKRLELTEEVGIDLEGNRIPIEVATMPVIFNDSPSIITIIRDIRDRVRANQLSNEITQFSARLSSIIDGSGLAIYAKTLEGKITDWNKASTDLFGWRKDEVIGKSVEIIIPDDKLTEIKVVLNDIAEGKTSNIHTIRKTKNGKLLNLDIIISPMKVNGKVIGASSIVRNVYEES